MSSAKKPLTSRWAIILAGGSGERLWPLSTKSRPKHLIPVINNHTLLEETVNRVSAVVPKKNIVIITRGEQAARIRKIYPRQGRAPARDVTIIAEPKPRNTFPAIVAATSWIRQHCRGEALISVFPADHMITPKPDFVSYVRQSYAFIEPGGTGRQEHSPILLWGIRPDKPSTLYGYIKTYGVDGQFKPVKGFTEKPDLETARRFVRQKNHYFNAGIFFFRASSLFDEVQRLYPAIPVSKLFATRAATSPIRSVYNRLPAISIDYAILERTRNLRCLPVRLSWNDVGGLEDFIKLYNRQNSVYTCEANNISAFSESGLTIAAYRVHDLLIVESGGKILLTSKRGIRDIRKFHKYLRGKGRRIF